MPLIISQYTPIHSTPNFFVDTFPVKSHTTRTPSSKASSRWVPRTDIYETDKAIIVSMELPGVPKEKVNIDVNDQVLTIRGDHTQFNETEGVNHIVTERRHGIFERSFRLPPHLKIEEAKATFEGGVLTIVFEKDEAQGAKHIHIQ
ncbi:uncharacterized protein VTP21DRAFT_10323 [Calcarisporiella thermophila]|uniref:uncharacterized protein n=1 Tax=Calcarisporiella thermophila TaxID=911321 RepID=UPI00374417AA